MPEGAESYAPQPITRAAYRPTLQSARSVSPATHYWSVSRSHPGQRRARNRRAAAAIDFGGGSG